MIGTSRLEYIQIRIAITCLRLVTPLSLAWSILWPFIPSLALPLYLRVWLNAEAAFYAVPYLLLKHHSQRPAHHPPLEARSQREALFDKCSGTVPDGELYLTKWFKDAPLKDIRKENVLEFFGWAFLNTGFPTSNDRRELKEYVSRFEAAHELVLAPGRGPAACLRVTLDEVSMRHRPLLWYLVIFGTDNFTCVRMLLQGFAFYRTSILQTLSIFPPRPQSLFTLHRSPASRLSYWCREHKSSTRRPIVFLHGIGIGLLPYVSWFGDLKKQTGSDAQVGVLAIELLPISARITQGALTEQETSDEILSILEYHDIKECVLVANSYGSTIATHLLKDARTSSRISSLVFVDPVSLLLHLPDIAYNFTYRAPRRANEWQLWYFATTDIGVAHTLGRSFFWSRNIVWKEDWHGKKCTIFLGGRDLIVNANAVWKYLVNGETRSNTSAQGSSDGLNSESHRPEMYRAQSGLSVVWCPELDHAQIFDAPARRELLAREVLRLTTI